MRLACIDIGSNTTRLLVADVRSMGIDPIEEYRAFTALGQTLDGAGNLPQAKLDEVVGVVREQLARARGLGARDVRVVATAAVRQAGNRQVLLSRLEAELGLLATVLSAEQEARLAFIGAAAALSPLPRRSVGVLDLGGGSCELAVGSPPADVRWLTSISVGSATLTARLLASDPPSERELAEGQRMVATALEPIVAPTIDELVAVGGSATSLRRVGGSVLDQATLEALLTQSLSLPSVTLAARLGLEIERARLLPAALIILCAFSRRFGLSLTVGTGGIREGVLLEAGGGLALPDAPT